MKKYQQKKDEVNILCGQIKNDEVLIRVNVKKRKNLETHNHEKKECIVDREKVDTVTYVIRHNVYMVNVIGGRWIEEQRTKGL